MKKLFFLVLVAWNVCMYSAELEKRFIYTIEDITPIFDKVFLKFLFAEYPKSFIVSAEEMVHMVHRLKKRYQKTQRENFWLGAPASILYNTSALGAEALLEAQAKVRKAWATLQHDLEYGLVSREKAFYIQQMRKQAGLVDEIKKLGRKNEECFYVCQEAVLEFEKVKKY